MRRAANVDANQAAVIKALGGLGCTVERLSGVGNSVPDLLVGICGINLLFEVKNPDRKGGRENTHGTLAKQRQWRERWKGSVHTVNGPEEAVADVKQMVGRIASAMNRP